MIATIVRLFVIVYSESTLVTIGNAPLVESGDLKKIKRRLGFKDRLQ